MLGKSERRRIHGLILATLLHSGGPLLMVFLAERPTPTTRQVSSGGPPPQLLRDPGQPQAAERIKQTALIAPGGVDPPAVVAHAPGDVRGRRWVVRHRRVIGRRRNVRRNRVGDVRAATHRYPSAAAYAHVGVGDPGGVNSDDRPGDGREGEDGRRRDGP